MKRLTYLTWGSTVTVCGALGWLSFQEPRGPSRRLLDGVEVELAEVTFGREHRHFAGNLWQRLWAMQAPENPLPTDQNEPVLWFHWRRPPALPASEPGPSYPVAAIDEHGCYLVSDVSPNAGAVWGNSALPRYPHLGDTRHATSGNPTPVYPRRTGRFRFALLDQDSVAPHALAEFPVEVPPAPPVAEWTGLRSPVTARAGQVEFILDQLRHEQSPLGTGLSSATFHYREAGKPSDNWQPESVTVTDATGNSFHTESPGYPAPERLDFWGLCRREPAWKLRVRFVRKQARLADAAFVWKVPSLPAPAREHSVEPHASVSHDGVTLQLTRIDGGTAEPPDDGRSRTTPLVEVYTPKSDSRYSLGFISATDERGHLLEFDRSPMSSMGDGVGYWFDLRYPQRTRRLHLTFGLFETHTVDFLVQPP